MLAYYNHTGRGYAGDRDRWNPLAKDLRLLTPGDVESFVEAHLRGAPLDAAGVHVLLVEDLHAALAVARASWKRIRRNPWHRCGRQQSLDERARVRGRRIVLQRRKARETAPEERRPN